MRRVVVTGLGPVTSIGIGKEEYWDSLIEGRSGISHITNFDTEGYTTTIGSEVKNFDPEKYIDKKKKQNEWTDLLSLQ